MHSDGFFAVTREYEALLDIGFPSTSLCYERD